MPWGLILYCFLRLLLWSSGVAIALFPTLQVASHVQFNSIFASLNADGHLRDLFFVIVPASAVSLSTTFDYLCGILARRDSSDTTGLVVVVVLVINVLVLVSGLIGFLLIPVGPTVLSPDLLWSCSFAITMGLALSLVTELWVSGAGERRRRVLYSGNSRLA